MFYLSLLSILCLFEFSMAAKGRNFYQILGVARDATKRQVKKAYLKLSKVWHPDKNDAPEASEKFQDISSAYQVLSDDEKRRIYDQYGEEGLNENNQGGGDPFDIFSSFFGGGGGRRQGRGGRSRKKQLAALHIDMPVTLKDLYNGRTFRLQNRKTVLCSKCRGTGSDNPDDVHTCPKCNGQGIVMKTRKLGPGFVQQFQSECTKCHGKGKIIKTKCKKCGGTKLEHNHDDELVIVVEEGMPDGYEIVLEQEGDEHPDYTPADLVYRLRTVPDANIYRDDSNLHAKLRVSLKQALLGVDTHFVHLDERKVPIARTGVTPPGFVLEVKNEGMPLHNYPSEKGSLFIEFVVDFPDVITQEQRDLIEKLFPSNSASQ